MDFQLKRGRGTETFSLEDSTILQEILPPETNLRPCTLRDVEEALDSPVGTPPFWNSSEETATENCPDRQ